jgi:hypothetical protein
VANGSAKIVLYSYSFWILDSTLSKSRLSESLPQVSIYAISRYEPNSVVFGSRYLKIADMIKKGLWLNVVSTVITMVVYFIRPYL